ncbi:MAG: hypothetical protein AAF801_13805, partial [Pseudomonadota bacterium]
DTIPQGVNTEHEFIGLETYHLDSDYRDQYDHDLHQALRAAFRMPPLAENATTATAATELSRPAQEIVGALFKDYLEDDEIKLVALQDVMNDLPLMLKLEGFLTETDHEGTIVFRDGVSGKVSFENRYVGMAEYHLAPKADDENRPTIHQALRTLFELPPLTSDDTTTGSTQDDGAAISDETDQVVASTETNTGLTSPGDETIEDAADTGSDIEAVQTKDTTVTTVRELWANRVETNKDPVYPPGYVPKS